MTWPSYARALQLVTYRATPKVETFEPDAVVLGRAQRKESDIHDSSPSSARHFGWFTYCRTKNPSDLPSGEIKTCRAFLEDKLFPAYEFDNRDNQEGLYDNDETTDALVSPIAGGNTSSSSEPLPVRGRRLFNDPSSSSSNSSSNLFSENPQHESSPYKYKRQKRPAKTRIGYFAENLRKNKIYEYQLSQSISLLDMSDVGTFKHIQERLGQNMEHILTDVFSNYGEEIRRQSDLKKDLLLASTLVDLNIIGDGPNTPRGWYHDTMLKVSHPDDKTASIRHNRELVLYNPSNFVEVPVVSGMMRVSDHTHGSPTKA